MKLRCADSALWSLTHGWGDVRLGVARAGSLRGLPFRDPDDPPADIRRAAVEDHREGLGALGTDMSKAFACGPEPSGVAGCLIIPR
jgi:hypothetical protein